MAAATASLVHQIVFMAVASYAIATRSAPAKQIRWEPLNLKSKTVEELVQFAIKNLEKPGESVVHKIALGAWREAGSSTAYVRLKACNLEEPELLYDAIIDGAFPSMLSFFTNPNMADYIDPATQEVEALAISAANNFTTTLPRNFKVVEARRKEEDGTEKYVLIMSPSDDHRRSLYSYEATLQVLNKEILTLEKLVLIPVASGAYFNVDPQDERFQELGRYAASSFNAHTGKQVVFQRVISAKVCEPSSFVHYELKVRVLFEGKHHVFQAYLRENAWVLRDLV